MRICMHLSDAECRGLRTDHTTAPAQHKPHGGTPSGASDAPTAGRHDAFVPVTLLGRRDLQHLLVFVIHGSFPCLLECAEGVSRCQGAAVDLPHTLVSVAEHSRVPFEAMCLQWKKSIDADVRQARPSSSK